MSGKIPHDIPHGAGAIRYQPYNRNYTAGYNLRRGHDGRDWQKRVKDLEEQLRLQEYKNTKLKEVGMRMKAERDEARQMLAWYQSGVHQDTEQFQPATASSSYASSSYEAPPITRRPSARSAGRNALQASLAAMKSGKSSFEARSIIERQMSDLFRAKHG